MHNIFLGVQRDLLVNFLKLPSAGKSLKDQQDNMAFSKSKYNTLIESSEPHAGGSRQQTPSHAQSQHSCSTKSLVSSKTHTHQSNKSSSAGSIHNLKERDTTLKKLAPPLPSP